MITLDQFILRAEELNSLVNRERLEVLYENCKKTEGEIWECGVYKGGTAFALSGFNRKLRAFDTFTGMPTVSCFDSHKAGDFSDCSLESVKNKILGDHISIYPGLIPETFIGLETCKISFAHIDVDIYQSVLDCCKFIVPRLELGGIIVFDDYGFTSCRGAKRACDEFFGPKLIKLPTRQAMYVNNETFS